MKELNIGELRDVAQIVYEGSGREGFVEDFIDNGSEDLTFMAMSPGDQEFWITLAETFPELTQFPPMDDFDS